MKHLFSNSIFRSIRALGLTFVFLFMTVIPSGRATIAATVQGRAAEHFGMNLPAPENSHEGVQVVSAFVAEIGELPEGVALDKRGNLYVTMGYPFWFPVEDSYGEIRKIEPNGKTSILYTYPDGPSPAGLAVSPAGVLYFAYPNPMDPLTNGVYRLTGEGDPERLEGSENIILANGLALTKQGDLYVSDSAMGAVWRISQSGSAEIWLQHEWLEGCHPVTDPVGANGISLWKGDLYVASTARGLLVRVPILGDRSAGEPAIIAGSNECDPEFDELDGMDGIAHDVHGNVFALLVTQHKLVRINLNDGSHTILLTGEDGLFNPASIAFGTGGGDRQHIFLSNFALLEPGPANNLGPSVLKYDVGVPGLPIP